MDSAKNSARETADKAKGFGREGTDDAKQWGRSVKDSAADTWDQTKRWGQDTKGGVEGDVKKSGGNLDFGNGGGNIIDFGHPLINRVFDGFIKVGTVGALHAASEDSYRFVATEDASRKTLDASAQRIGKEALQWGLVAGVYSGVTYGIQEARGVHDWKNSLFGGALTGVALSLTEPNPGTDSVIRGALTGGAIAAAAEILRNLT